MLEKIKNWIIKKLGGIPPLPRNTIYRGYFNGICPECKTHIGTYIIQTRSKKLVECGHCGFVFPYEETET